MKAVSVSQLNSYVGRILSTDPILCNIAVKGEVSNLTKHSSGHWYFSLKDSEAAVRCFLPYQRVSNLRFDIEEGMDISVGRERGDITLANNRVSKRHARFVMKDGVLYIQDLNSTNGVFVNGKRIKRPAVLHSMDSVRIEDYVFIVSGNKIYYYSE